MIVQHRKDLLGMTHKVRVDVIYMTWITVEIKVIIKTF